MPMPLALYKNHGIEHNELRVEPGLVLYSTLLLTQEGQLILFAKLFLKQ